MCSQFDQAGADFCSFLGQYAYLFYVRHVLLYDDRSQESLAVGQIIGRPATIVTSYDA